MLYQIIDGTVSPGGKTVLSHIDFEIRGTEKIGLVGRNGAGKTTLLRLLAGELSLDRDDRRKGPGVKVSRSCTVDMMRQQPFEELSRTVEEEFMAAFLRAFPMDRKEKGRGGGWERERFAYEREWDTVFTGFGFAKKDRRKKLSAFSGGEQTKIALIRLLLEKPDILLLDEPTNHLDMETSAWLEAYLKSYEKAVVMVSHDRFFLDRTADVIYELEGGSLVRYAGNYSQYREQKKRRSYLQRKAYERQQEELKRLNGLVERFKQKPRKASFARAKKKAMDRLERVEKPKEEESRSFKGGLTPRIPGSKRVFEAEHLKIGYERMLLELSLRIGRGQKIGILGPNGSGKTAFLKTVAGLIPPLAGRFRMGLHVVSGYFDQHSAEISSTKTVFQHFFELFPGLTEKEARSVLGTYLFGGKEGETCVFNLSGGEKARLLLAELLESRPNFLILDEPTNHMDIRARETLEAAFQAYTGTLLFVSHDRYFLKEVADSLLVFEDHSAFYYPFGYAHYIERKQKAQENDGPAVLRRSEEQALIDGLRSVPRAERRRLREFSEGEAYLDWRMRPLKERMKTAKEEREELACRLFQTEKKWQESAEFWREAGFTDGSGGFRSFGDLPKAGSESPEIIGRGPEAGNENPETAGISPEAAGTGPADGHFCTELQRRLFQAEERWQEACMEWYDVWQEEDGGAGRGMQG